MAASCACTTASSPFEPRSTELERYFDSATARRGPGVWKWRSYFSVYERHLSRFRGTDVHVMEIGIFSGGSLRMWRWYFGPRTTIYGVDISNRTTVYENDPRYGSPTRIFVGNQSDPDLWAAVNVPRLDVVIEDGGHHPTQQRAALQALWPRLAYGGVYLTEDVHFADNKYAAFVFAEYVNGRYGMNGKFRYKPNDPVESGSTDGGIRGSALSTAAVSFYHSVVVLDKMPSRAYRQQLVPERHGTQWEPISGGVVPPASSRRG